MGEKWMVTKRRPFDSVARVEVERRLFRKAQETMVVHEQFLKYLTAIPIEEATEVLKQLSGWGHERFAMQCKKGHPFYGDEEGFDRCCRVKYKLLYDQIIRMIDQMIEERAK